MVNQLLRHEHNQLGSGARRHDVEAIEAQKKLILSLDRVWVTQGKGGQDDVSLLSLETFDRVHRVANQVERHVSSAEDLLKFSDDEPLLGAMGSDDTDRFFPELGD
jgi:hypothetical protein